MPLQIWNLENRQERGEARQLEAQPKPWGTATFKWQMGQRSPGRKTEKVPSEGPRDSHGEFKATDTERVEARIRAEGAEGSGDSVRRWLSGAPRSAGRLSSGGSLRARPGRW